MYAGKNLIRWDLHFVNILALYSNYIAALLRYSQLYFHFSGTEIYHTYWWVIQSSLLSMLFGILLNWQIVSRNGRGHTFWLGEVILSVSLSYMMQIEILIASCKCSGPALIVGLMHVWCLVAGNRWVYIRNFFIKIPHHNSLWDALVWINLV